MPRIDLIMCLSRSHNSFLHRFLSSYGAELRPQLPRRPCLVRQPERKHPKKRVVFADVKGLALITVHKFSGDVITPKEELLPLSGMLRLVPACPTEVSSYELGFSQPVDDYGRFHGCLNTQKVCLEQCAIQGSFLQGTVQVHNVGYEKIVQMRITYNAWTSYFDVPCVYLPRLFGGEIDIFTFQVALPSGPPGPAGTIQFCFSFQCAQQIYWDNNQGYNYHLKSSDFLLECPVREQSSVSTLNLHK